MGTEGLRGIPVHVWCCSDHWVDPSWHSYPSCQRKTTQYNSTFQSLQCEVFNVGNCLIGKKKISVEAHLDSRKREICTIPWWDSAVSLRRRGMCVIKRRKKSLPTSLQTITWVWKRVASSYLQGVKEVLKNLLRGSQLKIILDTELIWNVLLGGAASSRLLQEHQSFGDHWNLKTCALALRLKLIQVRACNCDVCTKVLCVLLKFEVSRDGSVLLMKFHSLVFQYLKNIKI